MCGDCVSLWFEHTPLLHAIGLPALGQHHTAHHGFPPQGHVVISHVSIEVATEAAHFVLQPLTDADFNDVETVVVYLDVRAGVDHQKPLAAVDFGCQASYKWNIYLCAIHLLEPERQEVVTRGLGSDNLFGKEPDSAGPVISTTVIQLIPHAGPSTAMCIKVVSNKALFTKGWGRSSVSKVLCSKIMRTSSYS